MVTPVTGFTVNGENDYLKKKILRIVKVYKLLLVNIFNMELVWKKCHLFQVLCLNFISIIVVSISNTLKKGTF